MQTSAVSCSSAATSANQVESGFANSDAAKPGAASSARTAPASGRPSTSQAVKRACAVAARASRSARSAASPDAARSRSSAARSPPASRWSSTAAVSVSHACEPARVRRRTRTASVGSPTASARAAAPSSCAAAPSADAAASAIAVRIERPAPSASAIVRAHDGADRRSSSRQRRRRARVAATTAAGPASAATSPSATPPTSQPAPSSAAAATAHSRRRSGAVGSLPLAPGARERLEHPAQRGGDPGALDGGERLPRPGHAGARRAGRQPHRLAHRAAFGGRNRRAATAPVAGRREPAGQRVAERRAPRGPAGTDREELAHGRAAGDAHHLGDLDDPARPVGRPLLADDEVDRVGDLVADRRERQPDVGHQRERLEPAQRLGRAAGVDRAERAGVPGAQRDEQVERLGPAHLADDQPVRPHPQRVAHEPADRHLAATLEVRRPRLEPHDVRQRQPQLGGVLDRHDALGGIDERGERAERRRLARAGAAADQQRAARGDGAAEELEQRRRQRPVRHEVVRREAARAEAADRQQRPVERERRQHHVHARAVGQARVAERLGLVRAPPERRQDPLDRVPQLGLAREADVGLRRAGRRARPRRAPCRRP